MNFGLHVIQCPTGRYIFVGSCPASLGTAAPATTSDVMGGRAYRDDNGVIVTVKWPDFATRKEAIDHATARGYAVNACK